MNRSVWLVWNKATGILRLEVAGVPSMLGSKSVSVALAHFGLWPADFNDCYSLIHDYMMLDKMIEAPSHVCQQINDSGHRRIEWEEMWIKVEEVKEKKSETQRRKSSK